MQKIFSSLKKKINGMIWVLLLNGIFLVMLAILILWKPYLLNVFVAIMVLSIAWVFFYLALKIRGFKKDIERYLKI